MNKINDRNIVNIINEVARPFKFVSELDNYELRKCSGCIHLIRKERLVDIYNEPYFVCELLNREIDWPYRDNRPNDCPIETACKTETGKET